MALLLLLLAPDFVDIASESGLSGVSAGRAVFVDLDSDGHLDVVLDKRHFFFQRKGRFVPAPSLPGMPDKVPVMVLFADFDNDGDPDCFAGYHCEPENPDWLAKRDKGQKDTLYLNDGKGNWTAKPLGIERSAVHAACALDYDHDGKLDLFLGRGYRVYGKSRESYGDLLLRGAGDGGFKPTTLISTAREVSGKKLWSKPTYGVAAGDWDGDGWQDLWVCTYGRQWNHLWANGKGTAFHNVAPRTGFDGDKDRSGKYPKWLKELWRKKYGNERADEPPFRSNGNTFDCAIADYDNDGDMDCILAEITHAWAGSSSDRTSLLVQVREGWFERRDAFAREHTVERWNQGDIHCGWIDFDNDGLLDALIASSDYPDKQELKLYRQKKDHTFEKARRLGWEGAGQISVGDVDNDGDLDILCGRSLNRLPKERREKLGRDCALFRNDVGNKKNWLQVVCVRRTANRDGIGCRVTVTTPDGVTQTREIRGGLGHAGHNGPYIAHFGLGGHAEAKVTVHWPSPARQSSSTTLPSCKANQRLVVKR